MKLNVKLLRKVKKHILEEPKRVDMGLFVGRHTKKDGGPACGTIACVAGWVVLLSNPKKKWRTIVDGPDLFYDAASILGIPHKQAWRELFTTRGIQSGAGTKRQALEVARRIDQFIERHQ